MLAGLRSTAFCYLWFKSRFIPRALATWGMFASFLMGACAFSFIIFPELAKVVGVEIYASSGEFVGDGGRQRAVLVRNPWNLRQVESKDLC